MITNVLYKKGQILEKGDVFNKLVELNPNDKYRKYKAAGSLGGSRTQGYIAPKDSNYYECQRDEKKRY